MNIIFFENSPLFTYQDYGQAIDHELFDESTKVNVAFKKRYNLESRSAIFCIILVLVSSNTVV